MEHKVITHINCPEEWKSENDWDSHKPMLWLSAINTNGLYIELGSGFGSTPYLKNYLSSKGRPFFSFETNKDWANKTGSIFIEKYEILSPQPMSILFVDCAPADIRKNIIDSWRFYSEVIIAHDSEHGSNYVYGMSEILSTFKYRLDYRPEGKPNTTAVSNIIDFREWTIPQELISFMTAVDQKSMNL